MNYTSGPAFPVYDDHGNYVNNGGLSIRDYFAAKAMQGLFAREVIRATNPRTIARDAYAMADAMLEERDK